MDVLGDKVPYKIAALNNVFFKTTFGEDVTMIPCG